MTDNRTCGRCNACCIHIEIPVLDKPVGKPCQHLCTGPAGCCSIYADRPSPCASYSCAWLDGYLLAILRPDRSGILLDCCTWIEGDGEGDRQLTILAGSEFMTGALYLYRQDILDSLPDGCVAFVTPFDDRADIEILGKAADCDLFTAVIEKMQRDGGIVHKFADGTFYQAIGDRELHQIRLEE